MKQLLLALFIPALIHAQPANKPGSGSALTLNGSDQNVEIGSFFNYQVFTIDMWVKPAATQTTYADIMDNNHSDTRSWVCQQDGNNVNSYYFGSHSSTGSLGSPLFNLMPDKWQHLAIVQGADSTKAYVNGIIIQSIPRNGTINYDGTQFLRLGSFGGGGRYWNGTMDEVRMWNVALTQDQIRSRMCHKIRTSDPLYSNLILYYNFDESSGTTVFDATSNGHNGTLINNPTRVLSGAPIGNASAYTYGGNTVKLKSLDSEYIKADKITGSPAGIQLYRVDNAPSIKKGIKGLGPNKTYFGVFPFGNASIKYRVTYSYTGNPYVIQANEDSLKLYARTSNADSTWLNTFAKLDTAANTLITNGDSSEEYILGSSGVPLQVPPSVSVNDTAVNEGNTGTKTLKIPVRLNSAAVFNSSVNYATADSTAKAGEDYVSKSGTINFAIGQLTDTIRIIIKGDTKVEPNEIFKVLLSQPVNITIADTLALVTIKNDDANFSIKADEKSNLSMNKLSFSISPNPTKNFINIISYQNITDAQVTIADMTGKTLYTTKQNFVAGQTLKLSLSPCPNEVLIVTIKSANNNKQFKIIKE